MMLIMKRKKIIFAIIMAFVLIAFVGTISNATTLSSEELENLQGIYGPQDRNLYYIGARIIGVASYICYGVAVIILLYKGVQFMAKAPEAKAEAKKELVSYAIGAFILFGIGGIIQIIGTIAKNNLF